jgi:rhodanese-related sulfurtransferase
MHIKMKILIFVLFLGLVYPGTAAGQFSLWLVEKRLALKYDVKNISHDELSEIRHSEDAANYVLFDTRAEAEYDTSRIGPAILVRPDMGADLFIETFGEQIRDKHLIFYCSVGERSSKFIERVQDLALNQGARSLANLRGGIFRWYNEGHPVVNSQGETDDIHPYDAEWGRLVVQRNKP